MMKKAIALMLATIMITAVAVPAVWGDKATTVVIDEPAEVTFCTPFNITVTILNETGEQALSYDGNVTFGWTAEDMEAVDNATIDGNTLPYTVKFDPNWDGKRIFKLHLIANESSTIVQTTFFLNVSAEEQQAAGVEGANATSKIAVTRGVSDSVSLSVDVVMMIKFHVSPNTADFGEMAPCCAPKIGQHITLYNKGAKNLHIHASVSGEPFEEGIFINNGTEMMEFWELNVTSQEYVFNETKAGCTAEEWEYFWKNWNTTILTDHGDFQREAETDIVLKIPLEYGGSGDNKPGTLTLIASVFELKP